MNKLNKRFDKTFCLCFSRLPERVPAVVREMNRVGLDYELVWNVKNPFDHMVLDRCPHEKWIERSPAIISIWMGHYRAIKLAYDRGMTAALFLEDDCRFLKDTDELDRRIETLPADFDLAMLDIVWVTWGGDWTNKFWNSCADKVSDHWSNLQQGWGTGCYALSRHGMERMITMMGDTVNDSAKSRLLTAVDCYFNRTVFDGDGKRYNMYFAPQNLAIQDLLGNRHTSGNYHDTWYKWQGVDVSQYNIGIH